MASLTRQNAEHETNQNIRVPLTSVRNGDGTAIAATAAAGKFGLTVSEPALFGGAGTGGVMLETEAASGDTKTAEAMVCIPVPQNYVAGEPFRIEIPARVSAVAATGATLDIAAYISDGNGGVSGSDLVTTSAQDINSTSWATKTFVLTDTNLAPGQELIVYILVTVNDSTGAAVAKGQLGGIVADMTTQM